MFVNEGIFGVSDDAEVPMETVRWSNGLAAPMDHGAWILTGINTGPVRVEAHCLDAAPPVEATEWEEVVEISVRSTAGDLRINSGYDITPDALPVLNPHGPGWYRMRVHASGRSINPDGVSDEPVEDYLITVWPQEPAQSVVIRSSKMIDEALLANADTTSEETITHATPEQDDTAEGDRRSDTRARLLRSLQDD
ncbi:hypothetical protein Spla01_06606 [Streptomyces platensis]|uniref:Cytoplasmic protein n=2 Tax=Streptomyces platensis TaxID=58346 RepID=A0ABX3Y2T4_STRPT|nr:hypothetical protein BG653_01496 [Streptomyces platensis]